LLRAAARLQETREVRRPRALARDQQLDLPHPRLPAARPAAVAIRRPLRRYLAMRGANLGRDLRLHQLAHDQRHRLAHEIPVLTREHVGNDISNRHPLRHGHRGTPLIDSWWNRRVWNPRWPNHPRPAPTRTATPLLPTPPGPLRRKGTATDVLQASSAVGKPRGDQNGPRGWSILR